MGSEADSQGSIATVLGAVLVLLAAVLMGYLVSVVNQVKEQRSDLAELRDVRYGLLSADAWVERVAAILGHKIQDYELTGGNRSEIRENVALVLDRLIVEVDDRLRERNREGNLPQRVIGAARQLVQDVLVDVGDLRARVPVYADAILDELDKPVPKRRLQEQLAAMLKEASRASFSQVDRSIPDAILAHRDCAEVSDCEARLLADSDAGQRRALALTLVEAGLVAALFSLCLWRGRRLTPARMGVMTGAAVVLLAGGLLTPMIEIDARIAELRFQLLGEPVVFANQVLYFQSKSIFDVVAVLARSGAVDLMLVAFLVVLFSVWFPLLKIAAGFVYLVDWRGLRRSDLVGFFALKSGKWSMADVLVIAIFMAYVGFRGLVASQLQQIGSLASGVETLTTNGTALQPGFYLFLGFVLASLVLSHMLGNSVSGEGRAPLT